MRVVHIISSPGPGTLDLRSVVATLVLRQIEQGLDASWVDLPSLPRHCEALRGADLLHVHSADDLAACFRLTRRLSRFGRTRVLSVHGWSSSEVDCETMLDMLRARLDLARYAFIAVTEPSGLAPILRLRHEGTGVITNLDDFKDVYLRVLGATTRRILATTVEVSTKHEALTGIQATIERRETRRIAFVNAHLAIEAADNPLVSKALADFTLLNDGVGIDLASTVLYGRRFPDNLNGTDFIPALLDALRPGVRIYLLGASCDVITAAFSFYVSRWPQHMIVGCHHGFFCDAESPEIVERIRESDCELVLVGMGCPRQELWIASNIPFAAPFGIGVGALFDFQTGRVARAPTLVRRVRLEWVWRLCREPRRLLRRYIVGGSSFIIFVMIQWLRGERA